MDIIKSISQNPDILKKNREITKNMNNRDIKERYVKNRTLR